MNLYDSFATAYLFPILNLHSNKPFQLKERHDSTDRTVLVLIAWFVSQSCPCDSTPPLTITPKPSVTLPTFLYTSCPDHFKPQSTIKKTNARLYQTLWIHKVPHFIQTLLTFHFFARNCYHRALLKWYIDLFFSISFFNNVSTTRNYTQLFLLDRKALSELLNMFYFCTRH